MRTKLYQMPDWLEMLKKIGWQDAPNQQDVNDTIRDQLTKGHITYEPLPEGKTIAIGCRVTLLTKSVLPKFNKEKTIVVVGGKLFDAGIETLLIGKAVGQTCKSKVNGEDVTITITAAEQKKYPPLTNELVQALQIADITTLQQYQAYIQNKIHNDYAMKLLNTLLDRLLKEAKMEEPDSQDVTEVIDREYQPIHDRFSYGGEDIDTITDEKWKEMFYNPKIAEYYEKIYPEFGFVMYSTSKSDFYHQRVATAKSTICRCLLLSAMLNDCEDAHDPTKAVNALRDMQQAMIARLLQMIYRKE